MMETKELPLRHLGCRKETFRVGKETLRVQESDIYGAKKGAYFAVGARAADPGGVPKVKGASAA
jgi:hypothetical protein